MLCILSKKQERKGMEYMSKKSQVNLHIGSPKFVNEVTNCIWFKAFAQKSITGLA
jgi:hypothetical protein